LGHPDALTLVDQRRGIHMDCLPRTHRDILRRCMLPLHHMCSSVAGVFIPAMDVRTSTSETFTYA